MMPPYVDQTFLDYLAKVQDDNVGLELLRNSIKATAK